MTQVERIARKAWQRLDAIREERYSDTDVASIYDAHDALSEALAQIHQVRAQEAAAAALLEQEVDTETEELQKRATAPREPARAYDSSEHFGRGPLEGDEEAPIVEDLDELE